MFLYMQRSGRKAGAIRWLVLLLFALGNQAAGSQEGFVQHTDEVAGFVLAYPGDWVVVPGNIGESKFKVATDTEDGLETCSVLVVPNAVPRGADPLKLAQELAAGSVYEQSLIPYAPGVQVIEKGVTTVSNLPAFYAIYKFPFSSLGVNFEFMAIEVTTWSAGSVYKAQCATEASRYAEFQPQFIAILGGFLVTKR